MALYPCACLPFLTRETIAPLLVSSLMRLASAVIRADLGRDMMYGRDPCLFFLSSKSRLDRRILLRGLGAARSRCCCFLAMPMTVDPLLSSLLSPPSFLPLPPTHSHANPPSQAANAYLFPSPTTRPMGISINMDPDDRGAPAAAPVDAC
ncbi:hypothetical protein K438DRAFT_1862454, partial [Mycena galopus ATCC 62051]